MSLPESEPNDTKIVTVDNCETASGVNTRSKKHTSPGHVPLSEGNNDTATGTSHTGAIPKIRAKTASDNEASIAKIRNDLEALKLTPCCSDDNVPKKEWIRARDSLEHVASKDKSPDIISSKSTSFTASSKDKSLAEASPFSESFLGAAKNTCSSSVSKVLAWDPWDKLGRKNKKENKRRKNDKTSEPSGSSSPTKDKDTNRKDFKSGDTAMRQQVPETVQQATDNFEEYVYQPYQKTIRSVDFTNKVMVVYINKEDKVIGESSEPLKKEMEQQIRNKEMRRGHTPEATFTRRNPEWFKSK